MAISQSPLRLFVYGSLKRGHKNHAAYCPACLDVAPATAWGRLYRQPSGYPMLVVPPEHVLAMGTSDPLADVDLQQGMAASGSALKERAAEGDWEPIAGEIFTLADPLSALPRLDDLEDFRPGGDCLYHRVVVPVHHGVIEPVWTYVAPQGRLPAGSQRIGRSWP